ncbi:MAG: hypothetical protein AAF555_12220 [Verrucomicrobiota bacterium]
MRGFPLCNTLLLLALFCLAWWPLQHLTGKRPLALAENPVASALEITANSAAPPSSETPPATGLRLKSSHPLAELLIEHLGHPLPVKGPTPPSTDTWEIRLEPLAVPAEGIEFWIEARFAESLDAQETGVVRLELHYADPSREPETLSLWAQPGAASLGDIAYFPASASPY